MKIVILFLLFTINLVISSGLPKLNLKSMKYFDKSSEIKEDFKELVQNAESMRSKFHINKKNLFSTNGTVGHYISMDSLGKLNEVQKALKIILQQIKVSTTKFKYSQNTFTIDNFTLDIYYNQSHQTIDVNQSYDTIIVSGGKILFSYAFNFSVDSQVRSSKGWAQGFVHSDELIYKKNLIINRDGNLVWALTANSPIQLRISEKVTIQKMQPYSQYDMKILEFMLDNDFQTIQPSDVKTQILRSFNKLFYPTLNNTLTPSVMLPRIEYSYKHQNKGLLNMTVIQYLYSFRFRIQQGFGMTFVSVINQNQSSCTVNVPQTHYDFQKYGGVQSVHLICFYQDVVKYIQSKGWLNANMTSQWAVPEFSFQAGDLYDVIPSLSKKVNAKNLVSGLCNASQNVLINSAGPSHPNKLQLVVPYWCSMNSTTIAKQSLQILRFNATIKFYIKSGIQTQSLSFTLFDSEVSKLQFIEVNNFTVTNSQLAQDKAAKVVKKYLNTHVFGTGFPSIFRYAPQSFVSEDSVLYYELNPSEV